MSRDPFGTIRVEVKFNRLPEVGTHARKMLSAVVRKTASDIEASAKNVVPVQTGNLKNSIQTGTVNDLNARVNVGAHYGIYVEYGTCKMSARPFMRPAVERVKGAFVEACKQVLAMMAK